MAVIKVPFKLFQDVGVETKDRYLRFDLNALADFEQEVGMGLPQLLGSKAIFASTRALLWAGLKWHDRGLTINQVGDLMQKFLDKNGRLDDLHKHALEAATKRGALGRPQEEDVDREGSDEDKPESTEKSDPPTTPVPSPGTGEDGSTPK